MENNTYTHIPLWISAFACLERQVQSLTCTADA